MRALERLAGGLWRHASPAPASRDEFRLLAEEQAALRRVATLVARRVPPNDVFTVVAEEVGRVVHVPLVSIVRYEAEGTATELASFSERGEVFPVGTRWSLEGANVVAQVRESGRPARIDDYSGLEGMIAETARRTGIRSTVGIPIVVAERLWGAMVVSSTALESLPEGTEADLAGFTELAATAISNAESRAALGVLADEQAALRRVATLVARGLPPAEIFAAVAEEIGRLVSIDGTRILRYEADGTATVIAGWSESVEVPQELEVGARLALEGESVSTLVFRTGRPARIDGYANAHGPLSEALQGAGVQSAAGAPIIVDGRLWGVVAAGSTNPEPLPPGVELRLAEFTELLATAIANAESRSGLGRLAEEQAALRHVATLVARGAPPHEVFAAVTEEVGRLLGTGLAGMARYESDETVTVVATWAADDEHGGAHPLVPGPWPLDGGDLASMIWRTGQPVRIEDYDGVPGRIAAFVRDELGVRSSAGSPIVVEGQLWGALFVHSKQTDQPLPRDTESRLTFTELVATAIANTQARAEVGRLAEEQAALRRVATLVAREAAPAEVFSTVTEEVARLLGADIAAMIRLEPDNKAIVVAAWNEGEDYIPVGTVIPLEGETVATMVLRTGRPARRESLADVSGPIASLIRRLGVTSTVGTPIVVEGRLWGGMSVSSKQPEPLPADTESRIADFAELVATAIANADARTELAASRARVVAAADETRRRVERDLHDGVQQRLVTLGLVLRSAQAELPHDLEKVRAELSYIGQGLTDVLNELREISRGIHPAILSEGGLAPALKTLTRRSPIPVALDIRVEGRLPERVEVAAYYCVSEMLTNTAKHAQASAVYVDVARGDGVLHISVRDDGVGGADPSRGSGLVGLRDRVEALGGTIVFKSAKGAGTAAEVVLPLDRTDGASEQAQDAPPQVTVDPH
jgi:GAF domain-containing protein